jgi:hypothetical protein
MTTEDLQHLHSAFMIDMKLAPTGGLTAAFCVARMNIIEQILKSRNAQLADLG